MMPAIGGMSMVKELFLLNNVYFLLLLAQKSGKIAIFAV